MSKTAGRRCDMGDLESTASVRCNSFYLEGNDDARDWTVAIVDRLNIDICPKCIYRFRLLFPGVFS